jgi:hypothetical protein
MTGATVQFDLAIRSRIGIAASPEAIWPFLSRLQAWKSSVVSIERMSGEPDAEGETLRIGQRPLDVTVHMVMRTVRAVFPGWKVQTLCSEDGTTTDGYVAYTLEPDGQGTRVSCEVIARCRVPLPAGADVDVFAQAANVSTLAKLEADHAVLKQMVESGSDR